MVSPIIPRKGFQIPEAVHPPIPGESHRYYGNIHVKQVRLPSNYSTSANQRTSAPSSEEKKPSDGNMTIHEAAAAGNLERVRELLDPQGVDQTSGSLWKPNEVNVASGFTPLHYASSRGHLAVVEYLVDVAGAFIHPDDPTGETALLKASYNGHTSVVAFLLQKNANVDEKDNDGWTALHNAASQGHLKIVQYLLDETTADVDVKNIKGHTPLMNAASKGHIAIVEYLLRSQKANPLIKNSLGEAAYDVAATSQNIYICEILERAEREWWKGKKTLPEPGSLAELVATPAMNQPYDVLAFHISVPVVLHENQRASSTFSILRGPPKYSAATRGDTRGPWSLPNGKPMMKEDVDLPWGVNSSSASTLINATSSRTRTWCWYSDWQIDFSHPNIDADGWQYARSFEETDQMWESVPPSNSSNWVRRRRWVRIMKRNAPHLDNGLYFPLLKPDYVEQAESNISVKAKISHHDSSDYLEQAEAIINKDHGKGKAVNLSTNEQLLRYKHAISILFRGVNGDTNEQRQFEAYSLLGTFLQHAQFLEKLLDGQGDVSSFKDVPITPSNQTPTSYFSPLSRSSTDIGNQITNIQAESTTSLESFQTTELYWNPDSNENTRNPSHIFSRSTTLSNQVEPITGLNTTSVSANDLSNPSGTWEHDENVHKCRLCPRKFGLWVRRHHCRFVYLYVSTRSDPYRNQRIIIRKCGQVVCDRCSTSRVPLSPTEVLSDPSGTTDTNGPQGPQFHRVCDSCYYAMGSPAIHRSNSFSASITSGSSIHHHPRRLSNSSTMTECPACRVRLSKVSGNKAGQEEHVKNCLESRNGNNVSGYNYGPKKNRDKTLLNNYLANHYYDLIWSPVLFTLSNALNNPIIGQECPICFEEFLTGQTVTRLNCLCSYHYHCIHGWFARGKECPVHYR
ncbi:hypothetical protein G9A89_022948 [Geosiphon pyriformis]|nr:hypothetical protein G9A89_022948 [Geosiphon pyriformis]